MGVPDLDEPMGSVGVRLRIFSLLSKDQQTTISKISKTQITRSAHCIVVEMSKRHRRRHAPVPGSAGTENPLGRWQMNRVAPNELLQECKLNEGAAFGQRSPARGVAGSPRRQRGR